MFKHFRAFRESQGIDEDAYLGNIWGWKVSYIGLGVLVFLIALYLFRVTYYPVPLDQQTRDKSEQTL